jgi:hypothetical protein
MCHVYIDTQTMFKPCHVSTNVSFLKIGFDFKYIQDWKQGLIRVNPPGCSAAASRLGGMRNMQTP